MTCLKAPSGALEVWLKWTGDLTGDQPPTYEANLREDGGLVYVDWHHTAVGQVTSVSFTSAEKAREWLESEGFADYTA